MDERPNAIKKGVGKMGNMAGRSKRKIAFPILVEL